MEISNRKRALRFLPLLFATCFWLLSANDAFAADIVETASIPITITSWSEVITFEQFDPAVGVLDSVELTITAEVAGSVQFESVNPMPSVTSLTLASVLTITNYNNTVLFALLPQKVVTATTGGFDGTVDFKGSSGDRFMGLSAQKSATQVFTSSTDLAAFYGLGAMSFPIFASGTASNAGSGNLVAQFETLAGIDASIRYRYRTPAIQIVKSPDLQTVTVGEPVTFTIQAINTGQIDLINVAVTDPTAPQCNKTIGNLAVGETHQYECFFGNAQENFTNVATVKGETPTGIPVEDTDDAEVEVLVPAIVINKTPDLQSVSVRAPVTFTIQVTNTGEVDLVNVAVTDPQTPACDHTVGELDIGQTAIYTCMLASTEKAFTNVATVNGETPKGIPVDDDDDADVEILVPTLTLNKVDQGAERLPNEIITYTITYGNEGPGDALDVTITERIPDHTTLLPERSSPGWECAGDETTAGTFCTYFIAKLVAGDNSQPPLIFTVQITPVLPREVEQIVNEANISTNSVIRSTMIVREETPLVKPTYVEQIVEPFNATMVPNIFIPLLAQ